MLEIVWLDLLPNGLVCSYTRVPLDLVAVNLMYRGLLVVLFVVQRYLTSGRCKILLLFCVVGRSAEW